jgi:integrase
MRARSSACAKAPTSLNGRVARLDCGGADVAIKRLANGSWEASYRDASGKERIKHTRTRAEADRFLATVKTDLIRGEYVDRKLGRRPVREWADEWLSGMAHLRIKTRSGYESDLRTHVLPYFGDTPVGSIQQADVKRFVAELVAGGSAPGTVRNARKVLRQVLATAQTAGAIRTNPCDGVRVPSSVRQEMAFLSPEQIEALATAIGPRFDTLVRLAAYTGLRAGEICALRVGRVDLAHRRVIVAESVTEVNGHGLIFTEPKTYERRSVTLPRFLIEELEPRLDDDPRAFVFPSTNGDVLRHKGFYRNTFKPAVRRAGLPRHVRFHDLRHTCASLCIALGAHPKAIQERLGHSSITVTLDRYGHLFPKLDEALTDRLDDLARQASAVPMSPPSAFVVPPGAGESRGVFAGSEVGRLLARG